ncbi:hypothetical protein QTP88_020902 [Uroleucon formosanum]
MDDSNSTPIVTTSSVQKSNTKETFAETTANVQFPKKDQAVIFNTIEDLPQIEYIRAFSQLTDPNNIKFASRISNNRFCIYFANKNIVEQIITKQPYIVINNKEITFRRLINQAKRVIVSNVQPVIPHDVITNAFNNLSIKVVSPITFMKAGFANDEFNHIGSFRRQLYIHPDDINKMPSSILINFEQTDYRIFLSDDTVICYLCKQTGHTSNYCKKEIANKSQTIITENLNHISNNTDVDNSILIDSYSNSESQTTVYNNSIPTFNLMETDNNMLIDLSTNKVDKHMETNIENISKQASKNPPSTQIPSQTPKRPASSTSSTSPSTNSSNVNNQTNSSTSQINTQSQQPKKATLSDKLLDSVKTPQPQLKKQKRSNSLEQIILKMDQTLEPAKVVFETLPNLKINFTQLKFIIENTIGVPNPMSIIQPFNLSPMEMITIIDTIRPKIKNINFNALDIQNIIDQLPTPFVILGDFNSHNTLWGCNVTDHRGTKIETILNTNNINILNKGQATRVNSSNGNLSAIDLSFSSATISPNLEWDVIPELSSSDHFPIKITLCYTNTNEIHTRNPKWKLSNADWNIFQTEIEKNLSNSSFPNKNTIDENMEQFSRLIYDTALNTFEQHSYSGKRPPVPWWNKNIKHAIRNKKTSFNKYKRTKQIQDFIAFKKNKAQVRFLIKNEKNKSWINFTSSLNSKESATRIWNKVKIIKGIPSVQIKTILTDNATLTEPHTIAQSIGQHFYSNSSNSSLNSDFLKHKQEIETNNTHCIYKNQSLGDILNEPITLCELNTGLLGKKSNSCGSDKIPFIFLQNLPPSGILLLLKLFNQIWRSGTLPIKWKNAIITPIPKKNNDRFKPTGYRPISVLCSMSKLLEKIVYNRLYWFANKHNLLSPFQHGFRKHHSTTDCHVKIESEILETLANKQIMILISLDLQKAYDTVWRYRVIELLKKWNIHGNMIRYLTNFLSQRTFQLKIRDYISNTFVLENGVPQGSPLSVFLFQTAINNLPDFIPKPIKSIIFADDTHIYIRGNSIPSITRVLQNCLNELSKWCHNSGFNFSPHKTKCILFSNKKNITKPKIYLNTICLPFTENITILGLTFDSKLTWKTHILKTKKSAYKNLRVIKTLSHLEWGAEYSILLNLYRSLVRSKLDYGSICYGNSNCNISKILDPIHNTGIRCATGAFRSSPISSLLAITGEPPLHYRRLRLSLKYITRILSTPDNSTIHYLNINQSSSEFNLNTNRRKPLSTRLRKEMSDNNISPDTILQYETCHTPPWIVQNFEIDTSLSAHVKKETPEIVYRNLFNELIHTDNHNNSQIYTDASKTSTSIGMAVIHESSTQVFQLNSQSSIYTAEYIALLKGVQTAVNTNYDRIDICSDSLSVLSNIKYNAQINPLVIKIKNIINSSNKFIRFIWTPGHCNIRGNDEADKAARNATSNPNSQTLSLMSPLDIIRNVDKYCLQLWNSDWRQVTENKLREIKHTVEPWPKLNYSNRKEDVIMNRLRIGHSRITHGYLMEKTEQPICRSCNTSLTIKHIIIHCPIFKEARKECEIPDNIYEAIGPYADIQKIISFLKKIEMYNLI